MSAHLISSLKSSAGIIDMTRREGGNHDRLPVEQRVDGEKIASRLAASCSGATFLAL